MRKVTIIAIIFIVTSCSNSQIEQCNERNSELMIEIDSLKKIIQTYELSPEKLNAEALEYYKNKDLFALESLSKKVLKYHPELMDKIEINKMIDALVKEKQDLAAKIQKQKQDSIKRIETERMRAVNKLKKNYDDVSGITWYSNPYFTHYTNKNLTSVYIGKDKSSTWLILRMSYYGDDWIFFKNAYLSYDGNTKEIFFDEYRNKKTENDSSVWEWIDVSVSSDIEAFLREMIKSKNVKMRLSGKYSRTRNLSTNEIKGISDVLLAYDVLKNMQ